MYWRQAIEEKGFKMSARFQVVLEDANGTNFDVPVLKFRDIESGIETPSFTFDVKKNSSYANWEIQLGPEKEDLAKFQSFFNEVVKASEYELVFKACKRHKLDGNMLSKLIDSVIWLNQITCEELNFLVRSEEENEGSTNYSCPKKNVVVVIS